MKHDSSTLDFLFDSELDDFNWKVDAHAPAFADIKPDDDEPIIPTENVRFEKPNLDLPAQERIADLLEKMSVRRRELLEIIRFCEEMRGVAETNSYINGLQKTNRSVYSAATLCSLLERAGALTRVNSEGKPVADSVAEPVEVVGEDSVTYLRAAEQAPSFWVATEDGLEAAASDQPAGRLQALLAESGIYLPIYRRILEMCSQRVDGESLDSLNAAVNPDPIVQSPRYYATFFLDKLRECEALTWDGSWSITEIGREALASLKEE